MKTRLRAAALSLVFCVLLGARLGAQFNNPWQEFLSLYNLDDFPSGTVDSLSLPYERTVLAKARADECFFGIGDYAWNVDAGATAPHNQFVPGGIDCDDCVDQGGIPKVNQAYVWGLARTADAIFFGTGPNIHCLVMDSYLSSLNIGPLQNDSYVCEFEEGPQVSGSSLRDFRSPRLYRHDLATGANLDLTPSVTGLDALRLSSTIGIRSGGTHNGVVLLGGPSASGGIALFAFNASTNQFLGSTAFPGYTNIRKFVVVGGQLYTGVRTATGTGEVWRWTGDVNSPFSFETVGTLPSEPAELCGHTVAVEGEPFFAQRLTTPVGQPTTTTWLCVSTWPGAGLNSLAGVWVSPALGGDGMLTAADQEGWTEIWNAGDYEADPVQQRTYGGGAIASLDGWLYWGTMHVPVTGLASFFAVYDGLEYPSGPEESLELFLNTTRAISLFRAQITPGSLPSQLASFDLMSVTPMEIPEPGPAPMVADIELLYGYESMPVFYTETGTDEFGNPVEISDWSYDSNLMNQTPRYGTAGFNNPFNNYTWTMQVWQDHLFVGTMDWSYLLTENLPEEITPVPGAPAIPVQTLAEGFNGADLWVFSTRDEPARPVSINGVDNRTSYGIRTIEADNGGLYLGMANPMNLLAYCSDDPAVPQETDGYGGWELLRLVPQLPAVIHVDDDNLENGVQDGLSWETAYATLTDALDDAASRPDPSAVEIRVAGGTYFPDDFVAFPNRQAATFLIPDGVTIRGGYAGDDGYSPSSFLRDWTEYPTVLDGAGIARHVVTIQDHTDQSLLEGLFIRSGDADGAGAAADGGGVYISGASPIFRGVVFEDNQASRYGAGLYCQSGSPEFDGVAFYGNHSAHSGGAAFIRDGDPDFDRVWFEDNVADYYGGALYLEQADGEISNGVFLNNQAARAGGAIYLAQAGPHLNALTLSGNRGARSSQGGAIYGDRRADPVLENSILWGNTANRNPQIYFATPKLTTVRDCLIQGGHAGGTNILKVDPLFQVVLDGDEEVPQPPYLSTESPARDMANGNAPLFDYNALIRNQPDLGAIEVFEAPVPPR